MRSIFSSTHKAAPPASSDLVLRPDKRPIDDNEETRRLRARVLEYPDALFAIWDRVQPQLLKDFEKKRPLHQMWR